MIRTIPFRGSRQIPVLGQGTWHMGESAARRADEVAALRLGLDLGMTLIDTAEMYADGRAEELTAEAIEGRRDEVFLVSKVMPQNATYAGTKAAAEASLRRMRTDRMDLYLLHWRGEHPLEETLRAFAELKAEGKILAYGVSNFDVDDLSDALEHPGGGDLASNQILYNLERREADGGLLGFCQDRGINVMAYSPVNQGRLRERPGLKEVAQRHGTTPACVAVAWTIRREGVVAIPKAVQPEHVRENAKAASLRLTPEDVAVLNREFPGPRRGARLGVY